MTRNTKIVWYVLSLVALFFLLSLISPNMQWCAPGKDGTNRYLGFTCDAWILSVAELLGGAATMVAVVWAISHGRRQDAQLAKTRLFAVSQELRVVAKTLEEVAVEMEIHRDAIKAARDLNASDVRARSKLAIDTMQRVTLKTYAACCADIGRLDRSAARKVVEAAGRVETWNYLLNGTALALATDLATDEVFIFKQVKDFADIAHRECLTAATSIDAYLGEAADDPK